MKEFHVYHSPNLIGMLGGNEQARKIWAENRKQYNRVAVVDADSLDDVFRLTNHITGAWWDNEGVEKLVEAARSTSVGDVICQINGDVVEWFMVASFGFEEIGQ